MREIIDRNALRLAQNGTRVGNMKLPQSFLDFYQNGYVYYVLEVVY